MIIINLLLLMVFVVVLVFIAEVLSAILEAVVIFVYSIVTYNCYVKKNFPEVNFVSYLIDTFIHFTICSLAKIIFNKNHRIPHKYLKEKSFMATDHIVTVYDHSVKTENNSLGIAFGGMLGSGIIVGLMETFLRHGKGIIW